MNGLIVVAGGKGERFTRGQGKVEVKAFKGHSLLEYWDVKLHALRPLFSDIVLVSKDGVPGFKNAPPGATRKESVKNGFSVLDSVDKVLVHDAARPMASMSLFERVLAWLDAADVVVPVIPVEDALRSITSDGTEPFPRDGLLRVQTPQGFRFHVLKSVLESDLTDVDEASVAQKLGWRVQTVDGERYNLKVTYPEDVFLQDLMYNELLGIGLDFHKYASDKPLILGGVTVSDSEVGLVSWTDGDVVLHAVAEAVLSLVGEGDLGTSFPNSDEWLGASSAEIVARVVNMVRERGILLKDTKLVLIADKPVLKHWITQISNNVALITGSRVALSVTRSEGVFAGSLDGMICASLVKALEVKL